VSAFEAQPETARGRVVYRLLLGVHAAVRGDLERVERLAEQALEGLLAEDLTQELDELKRNGMLWRLRVDCLRYCYFVHSHHNAENALFFPELRDTNPAINPVIDRLEAEHRRVSEQLDAVEAAAKTLADDDGEPARKAVADALRTLGDSLLAHLDYEERNLEATVLRLRDHGQPGGTRARDGAAPSQRTGSPSTAGRSRAQR
jgi:iron-sulfur cluster repair protein YtfE (RIC family)